MEDPLIEQEQQEQQGLKPLTIKKESSSIEDDGYCWSMTRFCCCCLQPFIIAWICGYFYVTSDDYSFIPKIITFTPPTDRYNEIRISNGTIVFDN